MRVGIVGAGVAGTYLASLLAEGGEEVLLFDPRSPWEKPCGGGLTPRTFRTVPLLAGFRRHCLALTGVTLISTEGERCEVSCPGALYVASRASLGEYLIREARRSGARLVPARVTAVERRDGGWRLETEDGLHTCDFLVGADGVLSRIRRRLSAPLAPAEITLSVGYWVRGAWEERAWVGFVPGLSGYIWIFPREGHASVGIGARVGEASGRELYGYLHAFLERNFPALLSAPRVRYAARIPALSERGMQSNRICGRDWALIGDAAGWADPLTGEGLYYAFRSAHLLFQALSSDGVQGYERACRRELVPELCRAASYVRPFFDPEVTARLVVLARENTRVRDLLIRLITGSQSYASLKGELLKILPSLTRDVLFRIFRSE